VLTIFLASDAKKEIIKKIERDLLVAFLKYPKIRHPIGAKITTVLVRRAISLIALKKHKVLNIISYHQDEDRSQFNSPCRRRLRGERLRTYRRF